MAKFLTTEWLDALTATLAAHDGFKSAIGNTDLTLQFDVSDAPEGSQKTYLISISGGAVRVTAGPGENPDVSITNNYETAVAISKGEMNTQMAFMTGKIKVAGNMAKLMMNQAMLSQFANASAAMTVEY